MNMTMKKVSGWEIYYADYEESAKHFISNNEGFFYL